MTKVQLPFDLLRPIDELLMEKISRAHGTYGIERIVVASSLDALTVEFDASRLNPMEVEQALRMAGVPVLSRPQP